MKKVYFIAICGTGMASLAAILKKQGYEILGSDDHVYPPMSHFLEEQGIHVYDGYDPTHLNDHPDLVVIGNAMSRGNVEVEYVLNHKIPYTSLPAALNKFLIQKKYSCVVTGTHGKTTTSSMLSWILEYAGEDPSFFIGGLPGNFGRGFQLGNGKHVVTEGDEYDSAFFDKGPKFLHYQPDLLIINNIEFDHADIYNSLDEIKLAFRRLINIVPGNGFIIANTDDPNVVELVANAFSNVISIGANKNADWQFTNINDSGEKTSFSILSNGKEFGTISMKLAGEFNVRNALAAIVSAYQLGITFPKIAEAMANFEGVKRRLTLKSQIGDIFIFDDFAHHATAVKQTLKAVRQRYPHRRIWGIFEPRSASAKRKIFEPQYYNAFQDANKVVIAPLHRPDKVAENERLSVDRIIEKLASQDIDARSLEAGEPMLEYLSLNASQGDIFVFMSNGNFAMMPDLLAEKLTHNQRKEE